MNHYDTWKRRILGVLKTENVNVSGLHNIPKSGAAILAPNHLNWKDIFFLTAVIPRQIHFVGSHEIFDKRECYEYVSDYMKQKMGNEFAIPLEIISACISRIISTRIKDLGAISVKRGGSAKSMFENVEKSLKEKKLICIFPEGRTGYEGRLLRFKKGISKIVYDLWTEGFENISVVPAVI